MNNENDRWERELLTLDELMQQIITDLGFVDFTMGCNGEQFAAQHVKRLVEFYNNHSE
jgi:hypothetical protein